MKKTILLINVLDEDNINVKQTYDKEVLKDWIV